MKKSQTKKAASGTQWSAMFGDIFGLKAYHDKKGRHDKKRIPWQWALWGALIFFTIGFLMPTDSVWILLVAIAAAVIFYFARSTEAVEEQVLLLTDNRTPAQKEAHKRREAAKAQKAGPGRRPRTRQSAPVSRPKKVDDAPIAEVKEAAQPKAVKSMKVVKPRKVAKKVTPANESANETQKQSQADTVVKAEPQPTADVAASQAPQKAVEKKTGTQKTKTTRKPRTPKKTGARASSAKKSSTTTRTRRPRQPKASAAVENVQANTNSEDQS